MWDQFADHMYINTQPPAALRIGDTPEHHHFLVTQREMRSPDLLREVRLWGTSAGTWGWQLPPTESIRANRTPHPLELLPLKIKNNHDPQVLHSSFYEVRPIFSFPKHEVSPLSLHRTPPLPQHSCWQVSQPPVHKEVPTALWPLQSPCSSWDYRNCIWKQDLKYSN